MTTLENNRGYPSLRGGGVLAKGELSVQRSENLFSQVDWPSRSSDCKPEHQNSRWADWLEHQCICQSAVAAGSSRPWNCSFLSGFQLWPELFVTSQRQTKKLLLWEWRGEENCAVSSLPYADGSFFFQFPRMKSLLSISCSDQARSCGWPRWLASSSEQGLIATYGFSQK